MKLTRLTALSIGGCVIGVLVLLAVGAYTGARMDMKQHQVLDLMSLRARIDDFSVASDSLLVHGADPELLRSFRSEAQAIQQRLEALTQVHPDARKAIHRIDVLLNAIETAAVEPAGGLAPLAAPLRSRLIISEVAGHGIALDTALDDVLLEHQRRIGQQAAWIAAAFAAAVLLFAALSVLVLGLIHRRIATPVRGLERTVRAIRAGDLSARARVEGRDELAELAATLNDMLAHREAAERQLQAQTRALERQARMLAESQRIAQIGSWRLDLADERLEWSDETYRICGFAPASFTPSPETFHELVHPQDRERLFAERAQALQDSGTLSTRIRIIRPDGATRHLRILGEVTQGADGRRIFRGTTQDITEQQRLDQRLQQYERLVEGSEDLCAVCGSDYRYLVANQAYRKRHGLDGTAIEGRHLAEVLGQDYFAREVQPHVDRCLRGETVQYETERAHAGLGRRQLLARYYPIEARDGEPRAVGAVLTDLTDYKTGEAERLQQARLIAMAGRVGRFGGWSFDVPSRELTWSPVIHEIYGKPLDYRPNVAAALEGFVPSDRKRARRLFDACLRHGEPYDEELRVRRDDGTTVWTRAVGEAVRDDQGRIVKVQGALADVSARKESERRAGRFARRIRMILNSIPDAFFAIDTKWRCDYLNPEAERLAQRPQAEVIGQSIWDVLPPELGTAYEADYARACTERSPLSLQTYHAASGRWLEIHGYPFEEGLTLTFHDATARHRLWEQLRDQQQSLEASRDQLAELLEVRRALLDSLPAHIALLDADGTIIDVNGQWRQFAVENAYAGDDVGIGRDYVSVCEQAEGDCSEEAPDVAAGVRDVLAGRREVFALEYPCHSPDEFRWFRVTVNRLLSAEDEHGAQPSDDGETRQAAVVMHVDITERKLAEQELNRQAYEDRLTGQLTRIGLIHELSQRLAADWPSQALLVVLDIVDLRGVNDTHGYDAGDALLLALGERLQAWAGAGGLVSRIAGDEFGLFLPPDPERSDSARIAALCAAVEQPFSLGEISVEIWGHFGYTRTGAQARPIETLIREAELALAQCGVESTQCSVAYTETLDRQVCERVDLTRALRRSLYEEHFELHFQPKVELRTGRVVSAEALLRWNDPERGLMPPGRFIPIAEQSQLIVPIGEWVLYEACRHLRQWKREGLEVVRVAVNVSLIQFMAGGFAQQVREVLDDCGLSPDELSLEITESVFERESPELLRQLQQLTDLGVRLSLDDFGTGYSSLLYLQKYPFDEIKIDRGFVQAMPDDAYSHKIVTSVLGIAGALSADVVAEGIETAAIRDALIALGCTTGQGYFYSMPLEAEDFRWLLEKRSRLPLLNAAS